MKSSLQNTFQPAAKAVANRHIFFSYGHDANRPLVDRFKRDLEERGHRVWIDYERIGTWEDWRGRITEGIHETDMAVAFLSVHSVRDPGVCRNEIAMALQHFGRVYPLLVEKLGSDADLPLTLDHLQWPDLSGWREAMAGGEGSAGFEAYYQGRLAEVIGKIEGDASRFREEIGFLERVLQPVSFEGRYTQHLKGFSGRRWLSDAWHTWVQGEGRSRVFWLSAGPGFGKTAWAVHTAVKNPGTVVGTWFCEQGSRECCDPARALTTLAFQLAQRLDDYRSRLILALTRAEAGAAQFQKSETAESSEEGDDAGDEREDGAEGEERDIAGESREGDEGAKCARFPDSGVVRAMLGSMVLADLFALLFSGPMSGMIPRSRCVVVVDALDEAGGADASNPLADLVDRHLMRLPEWLRVVVTSRPDRAVVDRLGRFAPVEVKASDDRNLEDLRVYCRTALANVQSVQALEPEQRECLLESLVAKSGGMILYLQRIAEGLAHGSLQLAQVDDLGSGVSGLESYYLRDFQHRFGDRYQEDFQPLLRLILAAPGPLSEGFAAALLGDSEGARRARIGMGSYLGSEAGSLQISHKTVADWITGERSSIFFTDRAKGRRQIAEFLWKCFSERDRDAADGKVTMAFEPDVIRWLPDLLGLLPQWREAKHLRLFGEFLTLRRSYKAAVSFTGRAHRMYVREKGEEDTWTLRAARAHGVALKKSGDLKGAEPVLRAVWKRRAKKLGETHRHTLTSMEDLAECLALGKSHVECQKLRRRILEIRTKLHGADAGGSQTAMLRLGEAENALGNRVGALEIFQRLFEMRTAQYGFAEMRTLRVGARISASQRDAGDLAPAHEMAVRVFAEMERLLPGDDGELLAHRSVLGSIEEKVGNLGAAEAHYRDVFAVREAADPRGAVPVLNRLCRLLIRTERASEACVLLERAGDRCGGVQSSEDVQGIELVKLQAVALNSAGRRSEAIALLRKQEGHLGSGKGVLGYNLACYECLEGNLEEAQRLIGEHVRRHPGGREQALADRDLTAIRPFMETL